MNRDMPVSHLGFACLLGLVVFIFIQWLDILYTAAQFCR